VSGGRAPVAAGGSQGAQNGGPLLQVEDLRTEFPTRAGVFKAVRGVSFTIERGETLGIVGESGSGKSVSALSMVRLVAPPGRVVGGRVHFEGRDLLAASDDELRKIRGGRIGFVFQDPMTSLNPLMTVGEQITETLPLHTQSRGAAARQRAVELLKLVEIPAAEARVRAYPYEFSGGMSQRAMIAIAIACNPALLVADEPTTALDVTIQGQILSLIRDLQRELGMALLLITHDLGVIAHMTQRTAVMYAGRIVEMGPTRALLSRSMHAYTRSLMLCRPTATDTTRRLLTIPGQPPNLAQEIHGCPFAPRCPMSEAVCTEVDPELVSLEPSHTTACLIAQRDGPNVVTERIPAATGSAA
jgi:oligopeptide/dipeptide ABC transporter ATP-binding protein